jgi:predicted pyridoxine 5'-phosphate oxidase superfamily flavin-nucleotide-binding protein
VVKPPRPLRRPPRNPPNPARSDPGFGRAPSRAVEQRDPPVNSILGVRTDKGLRWEDFANEAAALASKVENLIDQYGFALIGTVRRDGTPRISPVETHLLGTDLALVMIPRTRKATDIGRDNRLILQSPVVNAANPGSEYKLRGSAAIIESNQGREAVAGAVEARSGWRPRPDWLFVAVVLSEATHIAWSPDGTGVISRWSVTEGTTQRTMRLDMEFGGYRGESD